MSEVSPGNGASPPTLRGWILEPHGRIEIERRLGGAAWLVTLHGEHNGSVRPSLDQALSVVGGASKIVVDLSPSHIDSSILNALLRHARPGRGSRDRLVVVAQRGGAARRLLDLCGVERWVRVFDTADEALRAAAAATSRAQTSDAVPPLPAKA
jgi:hypothetical protein